MSKFQRFLVLLYRGEQQIDFPRLWKRTLVVSLVVLVLSIASFVFRGLDLGIDFNGGTSWEFSAPDVSETEVRNALSNTEAADAKIQVVGGDTIRVRADIDDATAIDQVRDVLTEFVDVESEDEVNVHTVGPTWGSQVTAKARTALIVFFALVALYIAIRLEWKMAVGALAAVVHDIVLCLGFYSLFQVEITPATIIAFLTIMGYSLYDTVVVYDKVHEVVEKVSKSGKLTYTAMVNISLNRVLMRSINTSITSMLPILSMLVIGSYLLGAVALKEFSVALLLGVVVGTYSSLFVAASLLVLLKEREPANMALAQRLQLRSADTRGSGTAGTVDPGVVFSLRSASRDTTDAKKSAEQTAVEESGETITGDMSQQSDKPSTDESSTGSSSAARLSTPTYAIKPKPRKKRRKGR